MISDNSLNIQELVNERKVPVIAWTGAWRFASEYCFTVANGDIPTEGVMCAQWMASKGITTIGLFWEQGSSGRDYAEFFREECGRLGITVTRDVKLGPNPRGLVDHLRAMKESGTEAVYYGGYGYATFHFARAFKELDWDPPRVMGTAFMFYSNTNEWAEGLEGWHGVDQLGDDGTNPNYEAMITRFQKRFGRTSKKRGGRPRLRHRPGRHPWPRQRRHGHPGGGHAGPGAHPVDARHQRRTGHLRAVRPVGPSRLQG